MLTPEGEVGEEREIRTESADVMGQDPPTRRERALDPRTRTAVATDSPRGNGEGDGDVSKVGAAAPLPPEVWLAILRDHVPKEMWFICRDVCRGWLNLLPPPDRLFHSDMYSQRTMKNYWIRLCSRLLDRGWADCAKCLVKLSRDSLLPSLVSALRSGETELCQWIVDREGGGEWLVCPDRSIDAAISGKVDTFAWVYNKLESRIASDSVTCAARMGHIAILDWVWEGRRGRHWFTSWTAAEAASEGRDDVLRWMLGKGSQMGGVWQSRVVDAAARAGRLDIVEWLIGNTACEWDAVYRVDDPRMRHTEVFKWAVSLKGGVEPEVMGISVFDIAAFHGNVECMRWLADERNVAPSRDAMSLAIGSGCLDAVRWLHDQRGVSLRTGGSPRHSPLFSARTERTGDRASEVCDERLSLVEWMSSRSMASFFLGRTETRERVWEWVSGSSDLELAARIMDAMGGVPHDTACTTAAILGNLPVLKLMRDRVHWGGMDYLLYHAAGGGDVAVFEWLLGVGCPHSPGMREEWEKASMCDRIEMAAWINKRRSALSSPQAGQVN